MIDCSGIEHSKMYLLPMYTHHMKFHAVSNTNNTQIDLPFEMQKNFSDPHIITNAIFTRSTEQCYCSELSRCGLIKH